MTPPLPSQSTTADEIREAHDLLMRHYGEPVLPIKKVCDGIFAWLDAISEEHGGDACEAGQRDEVLHRIAEAYESVGFSLSIAASKSNLLWRLLYLGQPIRTKKCPEHDGHWSGYAWPGKECECNVGADITGWLS